MQVFLNRKHSLLFCGLDFVYQREVLYILCCVKYMDGFIRLFLLFLLRRNIFLLYDLIVILVLITRYPDYCFYWHNFQPDFNVVHQFLQPQFPLCCLMIKLKIFICLHTIICSRLSQVVHVLLEVLRCLLSYVLSNWL